MGGLSSGNTIRRKAVKGEAPSIMAASSRVMGTVATKPLKKNTPYAAFAAMYTRHTPKRLPPSPSFCSHSTMGTYVMKQMNNNLHGYASALTVVMMVLIVVSGQFLIRNLKRREEALY